MTGLMPESPGGLTDTVERILEKGVVINADIMISIAGTELLGIKIQASIASFETAAKYGMGFPSGTDLNAIGWRETDKVKATCPECRNRREERILIEEGCPVCGWVSPLQGKRKNQIT